MFVRRLLAQASPLAILLAIPAGLLALSSLQITTTSLPAGTTGQPYSAQLAVSGGGSPYYWNASGLPPILTISTSGLISGTLTNGSAGTYTVLVSVSDQFESFAQATLTLRVSVPSTLRVSPANLPDGRLSQLYSQKFTATGGTAPYSFSLASPNSNIPPKGVTLFSDGTVSGTPQVMGDFPIDMNVADTAGARGSFTINLTIGPSLFISNDPSLPPGAVGVPYSLTFLATGGSAPYQFTPVGAMPPGLTLIQSGLLSGTPTTAGTFNLNVSLVDSQRVFTTQSFQLVVSQNALSLQVFPAQLTFDGPLGGDNPPTQAVSILSSSGAAINFTITADGGTIGTPQPGWLKLKLTSGTTPSRLTVSADSTNLGAGAYKARVRIVPPGTNATPIDIAVTLNITSTLPKLEVSPGFLRFTASISKPGVQDQVLIVRNAGGAGSIPASATTLKRSAWIAPITGSSPPGPNNPVFLTVRINTSGLAPGAYQDVIRLTSGGGSVDVPISLFIAQAGAFLQLDVHGRRFRGRATQVSATPQDIRVLNFGDAGTTINWTADLLRGSEWLLIATPTGTSIPGQPGILTLAPSANIPNLPEGPRYALVRVSAPGVANSPQYFTGVLDLQPAASLPLPDPIPQGLVFVATPNALQPTPSSVTVWTNSNTAVPFQAATSTDTGGNWLSVSPTSSTSISAAPGRLSVSANATGLRAGIYTGDVNISMSGTLRTVNVTLILNTSTATTPPNLNAPPPENTAVGCTPAALGLTQVGSQNNFVIPAGWPATLIVKMLNDCGDLVPDGSLVASFSNGDPPLVLVGDRATSSYAATWQPSRVTPQTTVTIRGTGGGLPPASMLLIGSVGQNNVAPPVLAPNGTLNNLAAVVGAPLAPNTVAQVFGSNLASATASPGVVPLVTTFNGTSMIIGGQEAPLYFVSPNQLTVQIPPELAPNRQYAAVVSANNALTLPDIITLVAVQPGMAAFADGGIIAQHGTDFSLVDANRPAKPGEALIIYLVGMGATSPAVASAQLAPNAEPLARATTQPTMTVDGQPATIFFAGLTPQGIGLYQINFAVPTAARTGSLDVVVTQGETTANIAKLPVVR